MPCVPMIAARSSCSYHKDSYPVLIQASGSVIVASMQNLPRMCAMECSQMHDPWCGRGTVGRIGREIPSAARAAGGPATGSST